MGAAEAEAEAAAEEEAEEEEAAGPAACIPSGMGGSLRVSMT